MREAAWPLIRAELELSYVQIGVLLAVPNLVGALVQPGLALLGGGGRRRAIVLGGGCAYAAALAFVAAAPAFALLLVALVVLAPASGAFVSLSQATLMELDRDRSERNMARWVLAGSVGAVAGPLALSLAVAVGAGWRVAMAALAVATVLLVLLARGVPHGDGRHTLTFAASVRAAVRALARRPVQRWLAVLQVTDLMGDVLFGFLALYFVDVVGVSPAAAGLAVALWTGSALVGDALLLALLRRVSGLQYLRASATVVAFLFPAFLLVPGLEAKLALLCALGAVRAGWYAIPKAHLFSAVGAHGGVTVALSDVASVFRSVLPLAVGLLAAEVGLGTALWVALAAPVALLVLAPRR